MGIKDVNILNVDDIKPITISFKKNEDELILYKWILGHSNYSGFIKDVLKVAMNGKCPTAIKTNTSTETNNLIELDF